LNERIPRRTALATVLGLLAAHLALYLWLGLPGAVREFSTWRAGPGGLTEERTAVLFRLLLLAANAALAALLLRGARELLLGAGAMFLIGAHSVIGHGLAPDALTSGAMLVVSLAILYVGVRVSTLMPARYLWALAASYLVLFFLFVEIRWAAVLPGLGLVRTGQPNAVPLLLLFMLGLAACARSLRLLAYFWALVLAFTVCQPYNWEAVILSFLALTALFSARGRLPSPAALVCLGAGLAVVLLVLFPVAAAVLGESVLSLEHVVRDEAFREALKVTVLTATCSTLLLAAGTIPLAYGLSRLRFRGRTLLLSLIDLPIVVPQSAAGIMLVQLLGSQQYLGESLESGFGLRFDGTMLGICAAQVFVATPFMARSALAAFDAVPEGLELAARTLGSSSWGALARVTLPLASRGLLLGAVLTWARAAGEFGALVFIAENPRTAPVLARDVFERLGPGQAAPVVVAMMLFSVAMFFLLQLAARSLPSSQGEREARR
jgi:molybdate/tungstate transport system permease protein